MGQRPEITIQVIENGQGICCAYGRAFVVLSFDNQGDLVYVEDIGSARYARKRDEVDRSCLAFDHLRASALPDNHLGLYGEQIGASGEALGNFPQAFTHLALISAAVNLDRALDR
jgi:Domain of unknown function (DUF5753)